MNKKYLFFCAAAACATFVACALILARPNLLFRRAQGISVKGYAVERVVSDAATWGCSIGAAVFDPNDGARRAADQVRRGCETAVAFFKSIGVSDAEIETGAITLSPLKKKDDKGNDTNRVEGYSAQVVIGVKSADIKLVDTLFKRSSELAEKGVVVCADSPQYYYTKLESLKIDMIGKATANARERALKLTESGGGKLGGLISASQGVFQITQPLSTETSSYGVYETGSIEKDVKCIVNAEFAIER